MKTRTFRLNKLVRDKIVSDHRLSGGAVKSHRLTASRKRRALLDKLKEEASEFLNTDDPVGELADMQEVIDQLAADEGVERAKIKAAQAKKYKANGGFKNGDYIEIETWPAGHKWAEYYAADPKRFPEVK